MNKKNDCWAIIPAAGVGRRFAGKTPKQYLKVAGKSILQHSIERVLSAPQVNAAVVCVADNDLLWEREPISKSPRVRSTLGGETRAKSVLRGLEFLSSFAKQSDWVLVHDAVRPLLAETSLQKLISHCRDQQRGAILACGSVDTLKKVDKKNQISATLDRSVIWQAQTPQMFSVGQLTNSLSSAIAANANITDEASAMELSGFHVDIVNSSFNNFKLTTRADLPLLEFLMEAKPSNIET